MGGLRGCACGEHNRAGAFAGGSRSVLALLMLVCPSEMLSARLWF